MTDSVSTLGILLPDLIKELITVLALFILNRKRHNTLIRFSTHTTTMFDATDNIQINLLEVDDAEPLAGQLFKRSFNKRIPNFPKHFVLLANNDQSQAITLGYVHFTQFQNMYLGGGMCVNTRALRQLPKNLRVKLNEQGGVAFYMLSEAVKKLNDCDAVFGYVGHKGAYKIDLAVGFEQTEYPHLIVYWKTDLSVEQQQQTIQTARAFEPF